MKVLAVSGWKGSGKDSLANYLVNTRNYKRISFADPLKDMVAEQYGINRTDLDDPLRKEVAILTMPVDPKDAYSQTIAEFLYKEFRTEKNKQASAYTYVSSEFVADFGTFDYKKLYWTPRALAILEGSTKRSVMSDYWVKKAIRDIKATDQLVVLSDLRYKSEMTQLKEAFGDQVVCVRIERFDMSPSNDPSERDLDNENFDYRINNKGTLEQAYQQLDNFLATK